MSHALTVATACALGLLSTNGFADEEKKPAKTEEASEPAKKEEAPGASEWGVGGPYRLDLNVRFGGGARLDEPPAYEIVRGGGILTGVGLNLALSPRIAVGLAYEYFMLGSEESDVLAAGVLDISRELHAGWLDLKLYPIKIDTIGIYLSIGAAISVQTADLSASVWLPEDPGNNVSFFCGGTDDPGFAFQGALGVDVVMAGALRMFLEGGVASHRLSDDIIDGCAPGAGTATVLAARSGLGYAWDL